MLSFFIRAVSICLMAQKKSSTDSEQSRHDNTHRPSLKETFGITKGSLGPGKIGVIVAAVLFMGVGLVLQLTSSGASADTQVVQSPKNNAQTNDVNGLINTFGQQQNFGGNIGNLLTNIIQTPPDGSTPDGKTNPPSTASPENLNEWSPAFLRGGAGLFLGFCVGFAIRSFVKLGSVILGFYILSLLMLSWLGWIEINYPVIDDQLGNMTENLKVQFESFKSFLAGSIPTTGMAGFGFYSGIKKK